MRIVIVFLSLFFLLFGCLDFFNFTEQKAKKNKTFDFSRLADELELENISYDEGAVDEIDSKQIDASFENITFEKQTISVIYFQNKTCTLNICEIFRNWFKQEMKKYNNSVLFEYDTTTEEGMEKYNVFAQAYNIRKKEWYEPVLYIGGRALVGAEEIRTNLHKIMQECKTECVSPFERLETIN